MGRSFTTCPSRDAVLRLREIGERGSAEREGKKERDGEGGKRESERGRKWNERPWQNGAIQEFGVNHLRLLCYNSKHYVISIRCIISVG